MRPLTNVEVLDAAFLAVRRNWLNLYAASSVGAAPLALASIAYFVWLGRIVEGTEPGVFYTGTLVWAVTMATAWALNSTARGAVTLMVMAAARGESLGLGPAWKAAGRHWASAAFVGLLSFALGWLGTLFIVPGVLLAGAWWVARPVLLNEDRPYAAALRRSSRLTGGHRARAFGLWMGFTALWLLGAYNLHLLVGTLLTWVAGMLGVDTTGVQPYLKPQNQAYTTFILALVFVLLDPFKCAADAFLYLDLRIRREGADLQERLRALKAGAGVLVLCLCPAAPGRAADNGVEDYRAAVRALRDQVQAARAPSQVPREVTAALRNRVVRRPDGPPLTVENGWLGSGPQWSSDAEKWAVLDRLEALERSLGPTAPASNTAPSPAGGIDAREALKAILADPEFQPLAERTELRELMQRVDLRKSENWWTSFWNWVRRTLFKPPQPRINPPNLPAPNLSGLESGFEALRWVAIVLGVILAVVLLALLVRWFMERNPEGTARPAVPGAAPPLEASATENALDHTVDEWELFARQWLDRGDIRQAIRALYLATLVHLHRERRIDYNRAFTNWAYVRHFKGETEQRGILERLTRTFDEVWYGDHTCQEPQYRAFEAGVRTLGTPAPSV